MYAHNAMLSIAREMTTDNDSESIDTGEAVRLAELVLEAHDRQEVYVNLNRTVMVVECRGKTTVAFRHDQSDIWGPPVTVVPER
jgi:hypothetical protein